MNMKRKIFSLVVFCCIALISCNKHEVESLQNSTNKIEVSIAQSATINSRTTITDNNGSAIWVAGDKIALWAKDAEGNFALEAETFSLYRFLQSFSRAVFSAYIDPMAEGEYTYYATHPTPTSHDGTTATFAIPSEQDGSAFVGSCDIMVADPIVAGALEGNQIENVNFRFAHKMHALKIKIPAGCNLMEMPITRLEFTFPNNVVGDVTVDVTDPTAPTTLTNGSRKLNINIADGAEEGETIWAMIYPSEIAGDITYTAYSGQFKSFEHKITLDKNVEAAHVTPMSIIIPDIYRLTTISFYIESNLLGEPINKVTILDQNGTSVVTNTTYNDANGMFEVSTLGTFDDAPFSNKTLTACFESEHAKVYSKFNTSKVTPYAQTFIPLNVPYLFFEDFSSVPNISSHDTYGKNDSDAGSKDAVSFCNGWTGGRMGASAGKSVRLAARRETTARYPSRIDSAPLSGITKATKVKVFFNYGMNRSEGGIYITPPGLGLTCYFGYVTSTTAYKSGDETGTFAGGDNTFSLNSASATYDLISESKLLYLNNCTNATRLTWRVISDKKSDLSNGTYYLYLDNVIVQIAQ